MRSAFEDDIRACIALGCVVVLTPVLIPLAFLGFLVSIPLRLAVRKAKK